MGLCQLNIMDGWWVGCEDKGVIRGVGAKIFESCSPTHQLWRRIFPAGCRI